MAGPEEPAINELYWRQQVLYDSLMPDAANERERLTHLWDRIHNIVFKTAVPRVAFDPKEDAWHGPTTAVWHAAFTAGLIGLCLQAGKPVPEELREQWDWFVRGHWPSGYARLDADRRPGPLLVY